MSYEKQIYHIITSMGIGGAQKTLQYFLSNRQNLVKNNVIVLRDKKVYFKVVKTFLNLFEIPNNDSSIVCCWMYHSILIGLILRLFKRKITLVLMVRNGLDSPRSLKLNTLIIVWLCARLSNLASKTIYCSRSSMQSHLKLGYDKKNACFLYNGINPIELFSVKKNIDNIVTFSTIARNEPQKGYQVLLDALILIDNMDIPVQINYLFYGENISGLNIPKFKRINVEIHDPNVTSVSAQEILDRSECHILPSLSEGFANINLEALASGNFIICSNTGDSYIYPSEYCSIFPIADYASLAQLIVKYIYKRNKGIDPNGIQHFLQDKFPLKNYDNLVLNVLNA